MKWMHRTQDTIKLYFCSTNKINNDKKQFQVFTNNNPITIDVSCNYSVSGSCFSPSSSVSSHFLFVQFIFINIIRSHPKVKTRLITSIQMHNLIKVKFEQLGLSVQMKRLSFDRTCFFIIFCTVKHTFHIWQTYNRLTCC